MNINDDLFKVEAELLGLPQILKQLDDLKNIPTYDKEVNEGLKKGSQYLVRMGKKRLRERMISGSKGVTGNLLRSFTYKIKKQNLGVLVGYKKKGSHSWLVSEGTKKRQGRGQVVGNKYWKDTKQKDTNTAIYYIVHSIKQSISNLKSRYNAR